MGDGSVPGIPGRLRAVVDLARGVRGGALSLREIDRLAGRPEGHLGMILSGLRPNPTWGTLRDYATALGTTLDYLIEGKGDPPSAKFVASAIRVARAARSARATQA